MKFAGIIDLYFRAYIHSIAGLTKKEFMGVSETASHRIYFSVNYVPEELFFIARKATRIERKGDRIGGGGEFVERKSPDYVLDPVIFH